MIWDFFYRAENKNFHEHWKDRAAYTCRLVLPVGINLSQALDAAHKAGVPKGSHRSGIFEVQNDLGIYSDVNVQSKRCFKTWEQLENEEN